MISKTQRALMQMRSGSKWTGPSLKWPSHWQDTVHDEDGGHEMFGQRAQDGRATLRQELAKLAFADGNEWAQDEVSLSSKPGKWK